ncbi:MAG: glycosyltransferase [Acidimicrobiales bacterium]
MVGSTTVRWHPVPDDRTSSPYIHQLAAGLTELGVTIEPLGLSSAVRHDDPVHVHWPENLLRTDGSVTRRAASAVWAATVLAAIRSRSTPVVYTAHNLAPHDGFRGRLDRSAYGAFLAAVDVVICHQAADRDRLVERWPVLAGCRFETIEHGPLLLGPARTEPPPPPTQLVALGRIAPYKLLGELTAAWPEAGVEATLHIAGDSLDDDLADRLATADQVTVEPDRISDARFHHLLIGAHAAFALQRDGLTSGAAVAALTHGVPVIVSPGAQADELLAHYGADWVHVLTTPSPSEVAEAVSWAGAPKPGPSPAGAHRGWQEIAAETAAIYRSL